MRVQFGKTLSAAVASALLAAAVPAAAWAADASAAASAPDVQAIVLTLVPVTLLTDVEQVLPGPVLLDVDDAVLAEINFARAHPQDYAQRLRLQPVSDWERSLADRTDRAAYAEAIAFLDRQTPLPPLRADDRLAAAALEHVASQGAAGDVGHDGPGGEAFDARLRRHGVEARTWGENIAYGPARPSDVVRELIIDSGVPDRGHRRNIFYQAFEEAGVSCGPHRGYKTMCVMDFASAAPEPHPAPSPSPWRQADLTPDSHPSWGLLRRLIAWR